MGSTSSISFFSLLLSRIKHTFANPALCLQEKVYAGAETQAQLFMEYIQSSRDQSVDDDFDFDGERDYDGGSYDSAFAGNTRHNQAWRT